MKENKSASSFSFFEHVETFTYTWKMLPCLISCSKIKFHSLLMRDARQFHWWRAESQCPALVMHRPDELLIGSVRLPEYILSSLFRERYPGHEHFHLKLAKQKPLSLVGSSAATVMIDQVISLVPGPDSGASSSSDNTWQDVHHYQVTPMGLSPWWSQHRLTPTHKLNPSGQRPSWGLLRWAVGHAPSCLSAAGVRSMGWMFWRSEAFGVW